MNPTYRFSRSEPSPLPWHTEFLRRIHALDGPAVWTTAFRARHGLFADLACPDYRCAILLPDSSLSPRCRLNYRNRLNHLVSMGWLVFVFTVNDLKSHMADCITLVANAIPTRLPVHE